MGVDPKPPSKTRDRSGAFAQVAVLRAEHGCVACGRPPGSVHHVLPKGQGGDDASENTVLLCGDGASGCHGAFHGSPYLADVRSVGAPLVERRDRAWVARRIGEHIARHRPDTLAYLGGKLGVGGMAWLQRVYLVESDRESVG